MLRLRYIIAMILAFVAISSVNVQAAVLDTNLTESVDELTTLWGGSLKPLIWAVALALVGISWLKLTKKR